MNDTTGNLKAAFADESQANRRYLAFARKADAEGLMQVAKLFRAAAEAETRFDELFNGEALSEQALRAARKDGRLESLCDWLGDELHYRLSPDEAIRLRPERVIGPVNRLIPGNTLIDAKTLRLPAANTGGAAAGLAAVEAAIDDYSGERTDEENGGACLGR